MRSGESRLQFLNVNPTATTQPVNWSLIRGLAEMSRRAYESHTVSNPATDAQALVLSVFENIVVAFRGSSSPKDFLQDAKFGFCPLAYLRHNSSQPCAIRVHSGFLEDFDAVSDAVVEQVRELMRAKQNRLGVTPKIYITGHSLGGALAILCALEFSRQQLTPETVVTFGQPRVGNAAFADLYNRQLGDRTFHVVNANDPVPLSPPLLCGYRDEGNEIYLPHQTGYVVNPSLGFTLINDVLGALGAWRRRELAFLPNHLMKAYAERIVNL